MPLSTTILYNTPSDFTFSSSLIEVLSSAKLKSQVDNDELFYNNCTQVNAKRAVGSTTHSGTAIPSSGRLDCTSNKYAAYDASSNVGVSAGCVRFKMTPNYSVSNPTSVQILNMQGPADNNVNRMTLIHTSAGLLAFYIYSSTGVELGSGSFSWSPVAGVEYAFHINYDVINGEAKVYIDGVLKISFTAVGTRTAPTRFRFGITSSSPASNFFIDDIQTFSTPKSVEGTWSEQYTYSTSSPSIHVLTGVSLDGFSSFSTNEVVSGSDVIKYIIDFNGVDYYHDGASWVVSNGTFSQSNTESEVAANQPSFDASLGGILKIKALLHSDDGYSTPELNSVSFNFDFFQSIIQGTESTVYGYILENDVPVSGATIKATSKDLFFNNGNLLRVNKTVTTSGNGYFEMVLPVTPEKVKIAIEIEVPINGVIFRKSGEIVVPNKDTVSLDSLMKY